MNPNRPGVKTTEFWLIVITVIFSQVQVYLKDGITWEEALAIIAAVLGALGYSASRAFVKSAEIRQAS